MQNLSTEVQDAVSRTAKALGTTEDAIVDNMLLQLMAQNAALVREGLAGSELEFFPREADGALMAGRDLFVYIGVQHRLRLKRILEAEAKIVRWTQGIDTIYLLARKQTAMLSKNWLSLKAKLLSMNQSVPRLLEDEIAGLDRTAVLFAQLPAEVGRVKEAVA